MKASEIDDERARKQLEEAQAELERVEAGESDADRWQLEQRIRHAENQLSVAGRGLAPHPARRNGGNPVSPVAPSLVDAFLARRGSAGAKPAPPGTPGEARAPSGPSCGLRDEGTPRPAMAGPAPHPGWG